MKEALLCFIDSQVCAVLNSLKWDASDSRWVSHTQGIVSATGELGRCSRQTDARVLQEPSGGMKQS